MDGTRLAALLAAVAGVLFLGHALYQAVEYGRFAYISIGFGVLFGAAAVLIRRRAPRE
jgi:hypothetical protein